MLRISIFRPLGALAGKIAAMFGHRPTYAEIDLDALQHNFREIRRQAGSERQVLAVVKANAYGHGAVPVTRALEAAGADLFGVAIVEEGVELRQAGVARPILVLGGVYPGQEEVFLRHGLAATIFDLAGARRLQARAAGVGAVCPIHLKVDTGMGRIGFRPEDLPTALRELRTLPALRLEGVLSHLALADEPDHPFTGAQTDLFRQVLQQVREAGFAFRYAHLSNSADLFSRDLPECNLVRPGIALYGGLPAEHLASRLDLRPVMSFRTTVVQLKEVPAGTGISYGHRFVASRRSLLAAIPVGYADGFTRKLSNCGEVLVRGRRARVAGTVCMDWTLIDVTDIPGVTVGDQVTLLGRDNGCRISAEEWAERIGTISYEIFCQVSKRVPRIYTGQPAN